MMLLVDVSAPAAGKPAPALRFGLATKVTAEEQKPGRKLNGADLEQLVAAVGRNADREAFGTLFRHFAPRLKGYLLRMGAEPESAEELVQEAMIMVWRRAETFDPSQSAVSTWVFTIARNKRIDALRRERRPEIDPQDPALEPAAEGPADEQVLKGQQARILKDALQLLPREQAELVQMAYFEDKAHGAIAEETQLPLGTVKSRLRLALNHLRKALKEEL